MEAVVRTEKSREQTDLEAHSMVHLGGLQSHNENSVLVVTSLPFFPCFWPESGGAYQLLTASRN